MSAKRRWAVSSPSGQHLYWTRSEFGASEARTIIPGLLHIRDEGQLHRQGFNVYPLSNKGSRGFIFYAGRLRWQVRYSASQRRLCQSLSIIPKAA